MNRVTTFVLSAGVVSCLSSAALGEVTAEYLPAQYGLSSLIGFDTGNGGNTKSGQSFLAMTDGLLDGLRIGGLYHNTIANQAMQPLHIAFYDITDTAAENAHPFGASIAEWDVPASEIAGNLFPYSPTFAYAGPGAPIIAGRTYAFVLSTAFGVNIEFNSPYSITGAFDPYDGGAGLVVLDGTGFNQGWDYGFQVNVTVPGPGASMLAGLVGLASLRRRR